MKSARRITFWLHLAVGILAGLVVFIMSVTGVALTYEKQVIEWADRASWRAPDAPPPPLSPERILAEALRTPGVVPVGLTLRSDPAAPATLLLEGSQARLVDPYSGAIIGPPPAGLRSFFRTMTVWHRYLALEGTSRATGRAITGAANLGFLFLVLSGIYLWVPRVWSRLHLRNITWFRRGLASKARDFNWHNAIGIWSAVPLAIVVAGAVPISYGWGSALVYRLAGDQPPAAASAPARRADAASSDGVRPALRLDGIDRAWEGARRRVDGWRAITLRFPEPQGPLTLTVDAGYAGQPQKRGTLTVDRATGTETWSTFDDLSPGRRLRSWLRFAHTGEIYGLAGQTVAGLASAGGAVLVYTGLALAWRRFWSWRRRAQASEDMDQRAA